MTWNPLRCGCTKHRIELLHNTPICLELWSLALSKLGTLNCSCSGCLCLWRTLKQRIASVLCGFLAATRLSCSQSWSWARTDRNAFVGLGCLIIILKQFNILPFHSFLVQHQNTMSLCLTIAMWLHHRFCILDSLMWGSTVGYPSNSLASRPLFNPHDMSNFEWPYLCNRWCNPLHVWFYTVFRKNTHSHFLSYLHEWPVDLNKNCSEYT